MRRRSKDSEAVLLRRSGPRFRALGARAAQRRRVLRHSSRERRPTRQRWTTAFGKRCTTRVPRRSPLRSLQLRAADRTGRSFCAAWCSGTRSRPASAWRWGARTTSTGTTPEPSGQFGAAAAAGSLLRLDEEAFANALALVGTFSAGLQQAFRPRDHGQAAARGPGCRSRPSGGAARIARSSQLAGRAGRRCRHRPSHEYRARLVGRSVHRSAATSTSRG